MKYFLGVDGGKSSTTALIADELGRVAGVGRSGPSNHVGEAEGRTKFVNAIQGCVGAASTNAGLDASSLNFAAACLGFSGGPVDKESILKEILRSEQMLVTHDGLIALSGATAGEPGLIVIAGTGSFAFGRNAWGETARAGGWGYVFGDEGSAFHITRQALRAALRFEEGWGPQTSLRAVLLVATGARDANELLHRFYTAEFPRPRIAGLAKLIDVAAESGDAAAREILDDAASQLATIGAAVRARLFQAEATVRIGFIGGVFRSRLVRDGFCARLEGGNHVGPPIYGPAAGALLEAYRMVGVRCTLSNVPEEKL